MESTVKKWLRQYREIFGIANQPVNRVLPHKCADLLILSSYHISMISLK